MIGEYVGFGDPFFDGFASFVESNFSHETVIHLAGVLSDANRSQKGSESIVQILENRGRDGEAILAVIKAYIESFRNSHPNTNFDITSPYTARQLQYFSEAIAKLLH